MCGVFFFFAILSCFRRSMVRPENQRALICHCQQFSGGHFHFIFGGETLFFSSIEYNFK